MEYIIIVILLLCLSYKYDYKREHSGKTFWYLVVLVVFILLAGFRYRIGVDTIRYDYQFYAIPTLFQLSQDVFDSYNKMEPLCLLLWSFGRTISSEFWITQLLQAIFVNFVIFRFIKKNTTHLFFAVLMYFLFLYSNFMSEVMREACAVSMFLLGWEYLKKEKILHFFLFCILACGFHISAAVLFIIPILKWTRIWVLLTINKWTWTILLGIAIMGGVLQMILFDYIQILGSFDRVASRIETYAGSSLSEQTLNVLGIIMLVIKYILFQYLAFITLKSNNLLKNKNIEGMLLLLFVFCLLSISVTILFRYMNYFMMFGIIILAEVVYSKYIIFGNKRIMLKTMLSWYIFISPMLFLQINGYFREVWPNGPKRYNIYYPYTSIFSKEMYKDREAVFNYYIY